MSGKDGSRKANDWIRRPFHQNIPAEENAPLSLHMCRLGGGDTSPNELLKEEIYLPSANRVVPILQCDYGVDASRLAFSSVGFGLVEDKPFSCERVWL